MALLELKNITYLNETDIYGESPVIDNVSLTIEKGSVTAFLGKPGCGKSSALKILNGLLIPSSGTVLFEGKNIFQMNQKQNLAMRKKVGFMFQDCALWANQDIFHNLELPLQLHYPELSSEERKVEIDKIAKLVGFEKPLTLRPAALSMGEQKRISFARALIYKPEILFLDEPTESIDIKTIRLFNSIIKKFLAEGNTMVYVSHDKDFIKKFDCDRYIFEDGRIQRKLLKGELDTEENYEI